VIDLLAAAKMRDDGRFNIVILAKI